MRRVLAAANLHEQADQPVPSFPTVLPLINDVLGGYHMTLLVRAAHAAKPLAGSRFCRLVKALIILTHSRGACSCGWLGSRCSAGSRQGTGCCSLGLLGSQTINLLRLLLQQSVKCIIVPGLNLKLLFQACDCLKQGLLIALRTQTPWGRTRCTIIGGQDLRLSVTLVQNLYKGQLYQDCKCHNACFVNPENCLKRLLSRGFRGRHGWQLAVIAQINHGVRIGIEEGPWFHTTARGAAEAGVDSIRAAEVGVLAALFVPWPGASSPPMMASCFSRSSRGQSLYLQGH